MGLGVAQDQELVGGGQDTNADWFDFRILSTLLGVGKRREPWASVYAVTVCDPDT